MTINRRRAQTRTRMAWIAATAALATAPSVRADLPDQLVIADDRTNRLRLFATDGTFVAELGGDAPGVLDAPVDVVPGLPVTHENQRYENTLIVSDLRRRAIDQIDFATGRRIRTLAADIDARGLAWLPSGRIAVATRAAGVRTLDPVTLQAAAWIAPEPVLGPHQAWGLLVRPRARDGAGDILVTDPTLDRVLRFGLDGSRQADFARSGAFRFPGQIAERDGGEVLVADALANAVFWFDAQGVLIRRLDVPRPRGVGTVESGNVLVACDDGLLEFSGIDGALRMSHLPGHPETALRFIRPLYCRIASVPGDLNGDGALNMFDIDPFVLALVNLPGFRTQYPGVDAVCAGDLNRDGRLNLFDVDPFVELLVR